MRPVPTSAGSALRTWTRHTLPTSSTSASSSSRLAITASNIPQRRLESSGAATSGSSSFQSPFRTPKYDTRKIPSFKTYESKNSEVTNRVFQYFMAGSMGLLAAAGAKNTVIGRNTHIGASAC
ncbi:hypothetical protein FOPE_02701 [Fonsecaea pedrosoi]|nr:hypothetical protein FOPE_02701 [Fonsecaea pedrosoi]